MEMILRKFLKNVQDHLNEEGVDVLYAGEKIFQVEAKKNTADFILYFEEDDEPFLYSDFNTIEDVEDFMDGFQIETTTMFNIEDFM